jgi:hypothetical protein
VLRLRWISYSSNGITPGVGKAYIKAGSHQPKLTVESMAADGITVPEHLRNELHRPKIILIGQSICCAKTRDWPQRQARIDVGNSQGSVSGD